MSASLRLSLHLATCRSAIAGNFTSPLIHKDPRFTHADRSSRSFGIGWLAASQADHVHALHLDRCMDHHLYRMDIGLRIDSLSELRRYCRTIEAIGTKCLDLTNLRLLSRERIR